MQPQAYGMFWGDPAPYAPKRHSGIGAHRLLWLIVNGPIPDGHHLHHMCHVRLCVRPDHLTPLTAIDHQAVHHVEEKCSKGHAYTPENTYVRNNGKRQCRACKADRQRARYAGMSDEEKTAEHRKHNIRRRAREGRQARPGTGY